MRKTKSRPVMSKKEFLPLLIQSIQGGSPQQRKIIINAVLAATKQSLWAKTYITLVLKSKHFKIKFKLEKVEGYSAQLALYGGKNNEIIVFDYLCDPNISNIQELYTSFMLHEFWHAFLTILHVVGHDITTYPQNRNYMNLALPFLPIDDVSKMKNWLEAGRNLLSNALYRYVTTPELFHSEYPKLAQHIEKVALQYLPQYLTTDMPHNGKDSCRKQYEDYYDLLERGLAVQERDISGIPIQLIMPADRIRNSSDEACAFFYRYGRSDWRPIDIALFAAFMDIHKMRFFDEKDAPSYIPTYQQIGIKPDYISTFLAMEEEAKAMELGVYIPIFFNELLERHWQDVVTHQEQYREVIERYQTTLDTTGFRSSLDAQVAYMEEARRLASQVTRSFKEPLDATEAVIELISIFDKNGGVKVPTFENSKKNTRLVPKPNGQWGLEEGYSFELTPITRREQSKIVEQEEMASESIESMAIDNKSCFSDEEFLLQTSSAASIRAPFIFGLFRKTTTVIPKRPEVSPHRLHDEKYNNEQQNERLKENRAPIRVVEPSDFNGQFMLAFLLPKMIGNSIDAIAGWWHGSNEPVDNMPAKTALSEIARCHKKIEDLKEILSAAQENFPDNSLYYYHEFMLEELRYDLEDITAKRKVSFAAMKELKQSIKNFRLELKEDIAIAIATKHARTKTSVEATHGRRFFPVIATNSSVAPQQNSLNQNSLTAQQSHSLLN